MRLEQQVCTIGQGQRFALVGITLSLYTWIEGTHGFQIGKFTYEATQLLSKSWKGDYPKFFPAFTTSELGLMLPEGHVTFRDVLGLWHCGPTRAAKRNGSMNLTEAEARAEHVLNLIQSGKIDIQEINHILKCI